MIFHKAVGFWKPLLPAQQGTIQHMPPGSAPENGPGGICCSVSLSHTHFKVPVGVTFCLQTAGLTWSLKQRSKCGGRWQQPTPPGVHLHPVCPLTALGCSSLRGWKWYIKNWKVSFFFQKVANFILFQTNFSIDIFPQTRMLFVVQAWFKYAIQIQQTCYFIFYLSTATFCFIGYLSITEFR